MWVSEWANKVPMRWEQVVSEGEQVSELFTKEVGWWGNEQVVQLVEKMS